MLPINPNDSPAERDTRLATWLENRNAERAKQVDAILAPLRDALIRCNSATVTAVTNRPVSEILMPALGADWVHGASGTRSGDCATQFTFKTA